VRLAVSDPDPGGRTLRIARAEAPSIRTGPTQKALELPAAAFAGHAPLLDSDLFLTVDLEDLRLRYAR
jgi:hypothetical protein